MSRLPLVAPVLVSACAGGAFDFGEATSYAGMDPLGGSYNPDLARCEVTSERDARTDVSTYDARGRLVSVVTTTEAATTETTTRWKGPCRVEQRTERTGGSVGLSMWTCDDNGWPVSGVTSETTGDVTDSVSFSIDNVYQGRQLVSSTLSGDLEGSVTYDWDGDRLARVENDQGDVTAYTFTADGWIETRTSTVSGFDPDVRTWVYDDAGRIVRLEDDGATAGEWHYPSAGARWPDLGMFSGDVEVGLTYDCP